MTIEDADKPSTIRPHHVRIFRGCMQLHAFSVTCTSHQLIELFFRQCMPGHRWIFIGEGDLVWSRMYLGKPFALSGAVDPGSTR